MYFIITSTYNVHKYTIKGSTAKKDNCALGDEPKKDRFEMALASFRVHSYKTFCLLQNKRFHPVYM